MKRHNKCSPHYNCVRTSIESADLNTAAMVAQKHTHLNCHLNSNWNKCAPPPSPLACPRSFWTLPKSVIENLMSSFKKLHNHFCLCYHEQSMAPGGNCFGYEVFPFPFHIVPFGPSFRRHLHVKGKMGIPWSGSNARAVSEAHKMHTAQV